jgi:hypothetical protein
MCKWIIFKYRISQKYLAWLVPTRGMALGYGGEESFVHHILRQCHGKGQAMRLFWVDPIFKNDSFK